MIERDEQGGLRFDDFSLYHLFSYLLQQCKDVQEIKPVVTAILFALDDACLECTVPEAPTLSEIVNEWYK